MKKGQFVKCVFTTEDYLTNGKVYLIEAGHGDDDLVFTGTEVERDCFNIRDDNGKYRYCIYPNCAHATWIVATVQDEQQVFEMFMTSISRGLADIGKGINGYNDPQIQVFWENYKCAKGLCDEENLNERD